MNSPLVHKAARLSLALAALFGAPLALADNTFTACLARLRADAASNGLPPAAFDTWTANLRPDMSVLDFLDAQPEFVTPIWDYLAGLVDDERIADGRAMLERHGDTLAAVEAAYGVDRATVAAVWGVESNYGRNLGSRPLLPSLAALSCFGRRQDYFRGELYAALKIAEAGDVAPERLVGSWAGAFGQTQFMPSTFTRLAVDFDGDGRRDLADSVPDALASTANFLRRANWRGDEPWGFEVKLPPDFNGAQSGRRNKRPMADWAARGIRRIDGAPLQNDALPATTPAALLLPAGPQGPAFLVTRNFDALYAYNAAESYALAIALLSDRLRGAPPLATTWRTDDPGLSRAERRELQTLLNARGYDVGEADGIIGARTREALQTVQRELSLTPDGRAGQKTLNTLRRPPLAPAP